MKGAEVTDSSVTAVVVVVVVVVEATVLVVVVVLSRTSKLYVLVVKGSFDSVLGSATTTSPTVTLYEPFP